MGLATGWRTRRSSQDFCVGSAVSTSTEAVLPQIYEAALLPERWSAVLEEVGRSIGTPAMALLTRRRGLWTGYAASRALEKSIAHYIKSDLPARSDTTRRLLTLDRARFVSDEEVYSHEEWELEPFRSEWARRWGWNHFAATAVEVPPGDHMIFHVQRRETDPGFTRDDLAVLDALRPHLARAAGLTAQRRLQRLQTTTEALALIGLAACILDREGRVLAANALLETLSDHVRWLPLGQMTLVDRRAYGQFLQALPLVLDPVGGQPRSFASRTGSGEAAVLHLLPMTTASRDLFDSELAILIVTPVAAPEAPDLSVIQALYLLSATEARVAQSITRGNTVEQIAALFGVGRETVRSQLKAVLSKTRTTRQAELAALLAGLARWPRSPR